MENLSQISKLEEERLKFIPPIPTLFSNLTSLEMVEGSPISSSEHLDRIHALFPHTFNQSVIHFYQGASKRPYRAFRVGVVLSGGQAPGGHNVIAGLFDALKIFNTGSILIGFLGGPIGVINNQFVEITKEKLTNFRNTGGFDMIGSGRTKIETPEQLETSLLTVQKHQLDGLVIIGGDDSNTNAAVLAEYFLSKGCNTKVIGVPKTIDGDLKNPFVETPFGFDTACKVYSEMIGNLARDALSAKKYWHFVKLMGRSASHVTLECALETHPNITLISEEVADKRMTLRGIANEISDVICKRNEMGKNYGVILIPEGLIEFIPEMKVLIKELNGIDEKNVKEVISKLTANAKATFEYLPLEIAEQLLIDRDPHGNVQVSHIDTERLLIHSVRKELKNRPSFKEKFHPVSHFFGYEGRSGFPSNFDATYCYSLGFTATVLIAFGLTGYMAMVQKLTLPAQEWEAGGLPITSLMNLEERKGKEKPVIVKTLVDLNGEPFQTLKKHRELWSLEDHYRFPGPIQFSGASHTSDETTLTLRMEQHQKVGT